MIRTYVLPFTLGIAALAACGPARLDPGVQAQIDCLSAKTVTSISDTVKNGLIAGQTPDDLSTVEADEMAASLAKLNASYPGKTARGYFISTTSKGLQAIQTAVQNPSGEEAARTQMRQTFELSASCTFEGP